MSAVTIRITPAERGKFIIEKRLNGPLVDRDSGRFERAADLSRAETKFSMDRATLLARLEEARTANVPKDYAVEDKAEPEPFEVRLRLSSGQYAEPVTGPDPIEAVRAAAEQRPNNDPKIRLEWDGLEVVSALD